MLLHIPLLVLNVTVRYVHVTQCGSRSFESPSLMLLVFPLGHMNFVT